MIKVAKEIVVGDILTIGQGIAYKVVGVRRMDGLTSVELQYFLYPVVIPDNHPVQVS